HDQEEGQPLRGDDRGRQAARQADDQEEGARAARRHRGEQGAPREEVTQQALGVEPVAVLVTGGRDWQDGAKLEAELRREVVAVPLEQGISGYSLVGDLPWALTHGRVRLVLGDCPTGADAMARAWCVERSVDYRRFEVGPKQHPGENTNDRYHRRNQAM